MTDAIAAYKQNPPKALGGIVASLMLSDASAAAEFYKKAFGAVEVARIPSDSGDGRLIHLHLHINGASVMLNDPMPEHGYPLVPPQAYSLVLILDDIDFWWDRAIAAGATAVMPPAVMFWGDRFGSLTDPFGVNWGMNAPVKA